MCVTVVTIEAKISKGRRDLANQCLSHREEGQACTETWRGHQTSNGHQGQQ